MFVLEKLVSGFSQESCEQILQEYSDWGLVCREEMLADRLGDDTLLKQTAKEFIQSQGFPEDYTAALCMDLHEAVSNYCADNQIKSIVENVLLEMDEQLSAEDYNNVLKLLKAYQCNFPVDEVNKVVSEAVESGLISKNAEKVVQMGVSQL